MLDPVVSDTMTSDGSVDTMVNESMVAACGVPWADAETTQMARGRRSKALV
jgi:hypothetical protein